jgi:AcrR family transcriptional regulator
MRQSRSEVTRRRIINAAVELFNDGGYSSTGLGDIVERTGMTKGALYHHFNSKEALAVAIIDQASGILLTTFQGISRSSAPALESAIHGVPVVAQLANTDKLVRMGAVLLRIFAESSESSARNYGVRISEMGRQAQRAQLEEDLRGDIDAQAAGEFIVTAMLGTELISSAVSGGEDVLERVTRTWEFVLPAIASQQSLPYLREFLARESLRRGQSMPPPMRRPANYRPWFQSCSVRSWNVARANGSSSRISADLLIRARTSEPSACINSTSWFAYLRTTETGDSSVGTSQKS